MSFRKTYIFHKKKKTQIFPKENQDLSLKTNYFLRKTNNFHKATKPYENQKKSQKKNKKRFDGTKKSQKKKINILVRASGLVCWFFSFLFFFLGSGKAFLVFFWFLLVFLRCRCFFPEKYRFSLGKPRFFIKNQLLPEENQQFSGKKQRNLRKTKKI